LVSSALGLGEGLTGGLGLRTGAAVAAPAPATGVSVFALDLGGGVAEGAPGLGCAAGALAPGAGTLLEVPPAGGCVGGVSGGWWFFGWVGGGFGKGGNPFGENFSGTPGGGVVGDCRRPPRDPG